MNKKSKKDVNQQNGPVPEKRQNKLKTPKTHTNKQTPTNLSQIKQTNPLNT
jgi:hypothetical protein